MDLVPLRNWGATRAEVESQLPGDELLHRDCPAGTRSIDIDAAPERIFDFLAQMGFGRAGWYSYDLLDNLGRPSARSIHEEWLVRRRGEMVPGGPLTFTAAVVERPRAFVLEIPSRSRLGYTFGFTLGYLLTPQGRGTRLVSRVRVAVEGPLGALAAAVILAGDGVMVRRQLLGIKARAEATGCDDR